MFVLSLFLLASCQQKRYNTFHYTPVSACEWEKDSVVTVSVDTVKDSGIYQMNVETRISYGFPYQYLWLQISTEMHRPYRRSSDTLKCRIADERGLYQGSGLVLFGKKHFLKEVYLRKGQYGTVQIRHIMRRNPLPGISDIGLSVEKRAE